MKLALRRLKQLTIVCIIALFLLEMTYRFQWFDFYRTEWHFHNEKLAVGTKKILVFGDSFSADTEGWVYMLRDSLLDYTIYNAAMPGTGPETQHLFFADRVAEVQPDEIIVQLYVGNDLYDIEHPVRWSKHGFFRNLFWSISDDFRVLRYLNYRFGQSFRGELDTRTAKVDSVFSLARYAPRTRLYIEGDPNYPANAIRPSRNDTRFEELLEHLRAMKEATPKGCSFKVLLIPHCTQVDPASVKAYQQLGANITEKVVGTNPWKARLKAFDVLDPLPAFSTAILEGRQLYFANDPHLNQEGNRVLMEEVVKDL